MEIRDKQHLRLDLGLSKLATSPHVPDTNLPQGGTGVDAPTRNDQLDGPRHHDDRNDHLNAPHRLPEFHGPEESTRRGEAGTTAKSVSQLNATRITSVPPSQTLKRSASLSQPEKSSTVLPPRSRGHARQGSMMVPGTSRPSQHKMEVQDNNIALNPGNQTPTSARATQTRMPTTGNARPPGSRPIPRSLILIESSQPGAPVEKPIDPGQSTRMEQIDPPSVQRHVQEKGRSLRGATRHGRSTSGAIEGLQRASSGATDPSSKPNKPQFSTYQQLFSPRKSSSMRKGQIGSSNRATSIEQETAHTDLYSMQNELLRLHLLHDASCRTRRAWEADAERRLHRRFDALASKYQCIVEAESNMRLAINDQAAEAWWDGGGLESFESKVRTLSRTIQELSELSRPNGPYAAMLAQFVESLHQDEMNMADNAEHFHINMEDLGRKWSDDIALLRRKLDRCLTALDNIGESSASSSLGYVLARHKDLARNMMQELETMSAIHREAFRIEQEQRAKAIGLMVAGEDGLDGERKHKPRKAHVTAWR